MTKQRKKVIEKWPGGGVISLLLIATLLITSYAIYKVQQDKNVSNTKVGEFNIPDVILAVTIDGVESNSFPGKDAGYIAESVSCDNGAIGEWDKNKWGILTTNLTQNKTTCTVNFVEASYANEPDLDAGMIPVIWNGTNWVVADKSEKWYDYDIQWWANAINVTSSSRVKYVNNPGTTVNMDDVLFMWVWIPRYEYQYTNLATQYAGGTKEQPGGISIKFIPKTKTSSDMNYYIHDAFWWDDNNDGVKAAKEQLSGIWVAKFELSASIKSGNTLQQPMSKPNVASWVNAQVGTFWTSIKNNMNSTTGNSVYGISTSSDTHMMKNIEWGAVAYLSQSKFGKYGNSFFTGADKEVYQNKSISRITGSSNGTPSSSVTNTQVAYHISISGTGASTTGNIYGVYDMSGGVYDYVMGIEKAQGTSEPAVGYDSDSNNSGFTGKLYDGTDYTGPYVALKTIGSKYYDLYDYSSVAGDYTKRGYNGDATYETAGWYLDRAGLQSGNRVFLHRGGSYSIDSMEAGVFYFYTVYGNANAFYTSRAVSVRLY